MRPGRGGESSAPPAQLGVADPWLGPGPLLMEPHFARDVARRQVNGVVHSNAHRDRGLDRAWRGAGQDIGDRPELGADGTGKRDTLLENLAAIAATDSAITVRSAAGVDPRALPWQPPSRDRP
jgi:hypothetical protein